MPDLHLELHDRLVSALACPVCGASMAVTDDGRSLTCSATVSSRNANGRAHLFDGAAGGYVPLAPRHSGGGDSKEAVRARTAFLHHGYYAPAAEALTDLVREFTPNGGAVLDAGCGEGYYSNRIAEAGYPTLGVDLSKFAVDAAAKAARAYRLSGGGGSRTLYAVGSVFELPVSDESFDTVTNVFAPCAPAEFARVLKPGGHLIVAGAGERHLLARLQELWTLVCYQPVIWDRKDSSPRRRFFRDATVRRRFSAHSRAISESKTKSLAGFPAALAEVLGGCAKCAEP